MSATVELSSTAGGKAKYSLSSLRESQGPEGGEEI